jgi:hypothetical protein
MCLNYRRRRKGAGAGQGEARQQANRSAARVRGGLEPVRNGDWTRTKFRQPNWFDIMRYWYSRQACAERNYKEDEVYLEDCDVFCERDLARVAKGIC